MKTFPMFLQMAGRRVVIVGGGEQAAQKCRLMLKTEAQIHVFADALEPELCALAQTGRIIHRQNPTRESFTNTALVFIATGCLHTDRTLHRLAKSAGALVNVVDQPDLCDAITPSIVDRDPVVVAIGTEGTAPVLARQIKPQMEQILEPRLGDLAALAGRLRTSAAQQLTPRKRRDLWRWVFDGPARAAHKRGSDRVAAQLIKEAIKTGTFTAPSQHSVAFVDAGPGCKDLITLRGLQRLQEADTIFHDPDTSADILDLARRDAQRIVPHWAKQIDQIIAAAKQSERIVVLGINPQIQNISHALAHADITYEIVPGVSAPQRLQRTG